MEKVRKDLTPFYIRKVFDQIEGHVKVSRLWNGCIAVEARLGQLNRELLKPKLLGSSGDKVEKHHTLSSSRCESCCFQVDRCCDEEKVSLAD